jgi:hypothetical protein
MKDKEPEKAAPTGDRRKIRKDWEGAIERQIREAMERGDFENLPGHGKPLDLRIDPNTPPGWELAFKMLKDAGFAPEWIEQDKEIRAARNRVFKPLERYRIGQGEARKDRAAAEARLIADFRKQASELNHMIDDFNLKAPSPRLHHARIRIEVEIAMFKEEIQRGQA